MTNIVSMAGKGNLKGVEEELEKCGNIDVQDVDGRTALMRAVEGGHVAVAELLLRSGANPNCVGNSSYDNDEEKTTALQLCVSELENDKIALLAAKLIEFGADVNYADEDGFTVLMGVAADGNLAAVNLFVAAGADVNACEIDGKSALYYACGAQDEKAAKQIVASLLSSNASSEIECEGTSCLMRAAELGRPDVVRLLLEYGGKALVSSESDTAFSRAVNGMLEEFSLIALKDQKRYNTLQSRYMQIVAEGSQNKLPQKLWNYHLVLELLLKNGCPAGNCAVGLLAIGRTDLLHRVRPEDLGDALAYATKGKKLNWIRQLIELGADPNCENPPLLSVTKSNQELTELLLESGANVNLTIGSDTLLDLAIWWQRNETAEILIENGASVHANRPLFWAVVHNNLEILDLLLSRGADPNEQEPPLGRYPEKTTLLMIAASEGQCEIVGRLLSSKADVDARDENGDSAVDHATKKGHWNIVEQIQKKSKSRLSTIGYSKRLLIAAKEGKVELVHEALENGANVDFADEDGCTPLIYAATEGHELVVKQLIDFNANIDAKSHPGYQGNLTPLRCACAREHVAVVDQLLKAGANPDQAFEYSSLPAEKPGFACPAYGAPLHDAARVGNEEIVALLLDGGADVNCCDTEDETPLVRAVRHRHWEIANTLIRHGAIRRPQNEHHLAALDFDKHASSDSFSTSLTDVGDRTGFNSFSAAEIPGVSLFKTDLDRFEDREKLHEHVRSLNLECLRRGHHVICRGSSLLLYPGRPHVILLKMRHRIDQGSLETIRASFSCL